MLFKNDFLLFQFRFKPKISSRKLFPSDSSKIMPKISHRKKRFRQGYASNILTVAGLPQVQSPGALFPIARSCSAFWSSLKKISKKERKDRQLNVLQVLLFSRNFNASFKNKSSSNVLQD